MIYVNIVEHPFWSLKSPSYLLPFPCRTCQMKICCRSFQLHPATASPFEDSRINRGSSWTTDLQHIVNRFSNRSAFKSSFKNIFIIIKWGIIFTHQEVLQSDCPESSCTHSFLHNGRSCSPFLLTVVQKDNQQSIP